MFQERSEPYIIFDEPILSPFTLLPALPTQNPSDIFLRLRVDDEFLLNRIIIPRNDSRRFKLVSIIQNNGLCLVCVAIEFQFIGLQKDPIACFERAEIESLKQQRMFREISGVDVEKIMAAQIEASELVFQKRVNGGEYVLLPNYVAVKMSLNHTTLHSGEIQFQENSNFNVRGVLPYNRRMLREISAMQHINSIPPNPRINHSNVFLQNSFCVMMISPYFQYSLEDYFQINRMENDEHLQRIVFKILEGLHHIHSTLKMSHRDISPDNILINPIWNEENAIVDFDVKLIDFEHSIIVPDIDTIINSETVPIGKNHYRCPEFDSLSNYLGYSADIWSLAEVLYYALTGQNLFDFGYSQTTHIRDVTVFGELGDVFEEGSHSEEVKLFLLRCYRLSKLERPKAEELMDDDWFGFINRLLIQALNHTDR